MTLLVASLTQRHARDMRAAALDALDRGADAVEFRLDLLQDGESDIRGVANDLTIGQWIATCRPAAEGGAYHGPVERRVERLLTAGPVGDGVLDFEFADWKRSDLARNDLIRGNATIGRMEHPPSILLSHHDFQGRPPNLDALLTEMASVPEAAALKIAWRGQDIFDAIQALDMMRRSPKPLTAISMGEDGLLSRVLANKVGAFASYCAYEAGSEAAPGQLSLDDMVRRYRWRDIDQHTELYGVIGNPVAHSLGPILFNAAFATGRIPGVYLPLRVPDGYDAFARFMDETLSRDWLDLKGLSVTAPHKVNALQYLGDRIDPPADEIGAVNTIRYEDGELWGCNTDFAAAIDTILAGMDIPEASFDGMPVDVLGAGGVARAVVAGLLDLGCSVTVYNRDEDRARTLASDFECKSRPWEDRARCDGALLVNCTSVGMAPNVDESPMPADALRSEQAVFDTVYRPATTRLLREAGDRGCRVIDGVGMFIRQAIQQFEYWTQQAADAELMARIVLGAMAESPTEPPQSRE